MKAPFTPQAELDMEALERLSEPPEIHGEHLLTVSVMGLGVNILGLVFFHDVAHAHGGHGHEEADDAAHSALGQGGNALVLRRAGGGGHGGGGGEDRKSVV